MKSNIKKFVSENKLIKIMGVFLIAGSIAYGQNIERENQQIDSDIEWFWAVDTTKNTDKQEAEIISLVVNIKNTLAQVLVSVDETEQEKIYTDSLYKSWNKESELNFIENNINSDMNLIKKAAIRFIKN